MLITTSVVRFNWLLPQCFDLLYFLSKICVGMHISMFLVNNFRCGMSVNVYRAITNYCPGNNYHIHPVLTLIWGRSINSYG